MHVACAHGMCKEKVNEKKTSRLGAYMVEREMTPLYNHAVASDVSISFSHPDTRNQRHERCTVTLPPYPSHSHTVRPRFPTPRDIREVKATWEI